MQLRNPLCHGGDLEGVWGSWAVPGIPHPGSVHGTRFYAGKTAREQFELMWKEDGARCPISA